MTKPWLTIIGILFVCATAHAERPKTFKETLKSPVDIRFEPAAAKPGDTVTLKVTLDPIDGFYTYVTQQPDPGAKAFANRIVFPKAGPIVFVGPFVDPAGAKSKTEEINGTPVTSLYYPHSVTWERQAIIAHGTLPGKITVALRESPDGLATKFQVCDNIGCFPGSGNFAAELTVLPGPDVPYDPKYKAAVESALGQVIEIKKDPVVIPKKEEVAPPAVKEADKKKEKFRIAKDRDYALDMEAVKAMLPPDSKGKFVLGQGDNAGFFAFVLTAMFWGAVTLLTPCVFPMIPITVSFFLKQGEKKLHNPLAMATVYTFTIILVLGIAALFFLATFRKLSVDPWMNTALGILFVVFALSLFGMYDIVLPNFLVRFTSAREGKGGYGGVIFMALSFSIVSFTCVAPFLGGFAGMAASGQFTNLQLAAGAFAFAGTFAAPFFLLAMFPVLLKKLPRSGGWMNTIKVVMGFVELAAALKFFRTAELRWSIPTNLFTYDLVLGMWVAILLLSGFYLLNLYRLPHDEPQEHIGVPRMLVGLMAISVSIYLIPGLFVGHGNEKQRPTGILYAWVDAFLLPEPAEEAWSSDLRAAIEKARAANETVFVDFTGVNCTNCRLNEKDVFPRLEIRLLLEQYRLVQLYTDTVPPQSYDAAPDEAKRDRHAEINLRFQENVFGTEQLPLYVILRPDPGERGGPVQIVGVYDEGKINNVSKFEEFLKKGLERSPK